MQLDILKNKISFHIFLKFSNFFPDSESKFTILIILEDITHI